MDNEYWQKVGETELLALEENNIGCSVIDACGSTNINLRGV